ncbi:MAG: Nramp family divalent metal transporter, partial [Phycisphaerales bacterium]|nr:Nramp family divalent metal transporter [Phycisphaerales bacterium]
MPTKVPKAPHGWAILAMVGPSLIWCGEYIGSGEVILATRTGAMLGVAILWAVVLAIVLKFCIGVAGARWAAVTGEGMIDMFARMPGPGHWLVWLVLIIQLPAGIVSIGALASAAGTFLNSLLPLPWEHGKPIWGLIISTFAVSVAWTGRFDLLKKVMLGLVMIVVIGVWYVAIIVHPPVGDIFRGLFGLLPLHVPEWVASDTGGTTVWRELLPLTGWAAGGFASQVWYSYWVLGAGYGMAHGRGWGRPADTSALAALKDEEVREVRGWCRMVSADATVALVIGVMATIGFVLAGAAVLRPQQLLPDGEQTAVTLSNIFSGHWGRLGGTLFLVSGSAAMISTLVGLLSGWPRLLADCVRIVYPPFARLSWKVQFRSFLMLFVITNLAAVMFFEPVRLIKLGGQLDGILLTPIQALALLVGFWFVLPRMIGRA